MDTNKNEFNKNPLTDNYALMSSIPWGWVLCFGLTTIWVATLFSQTLFLNGCKENSSEPENKPKEFTWRIDSISYPGSFQTMMRDMWANSDSDIYIVGYNDQNRGKMFHYNGKNWYPVSLTSTEGGPIPRSFDLLSIHGISASTIYTVGVRYHNDIFSHTSNESSLVLLFDGTKWKEKKTIDDRLLATVWTLSANEIFVGGEKGLLMKLENDVWIKYELGREYFFSSLIARSSNEAYAIGHIEDKSFPIDSAGSFLFKFVIAL